MLSLGRLAGVTSVLVLSVWLAPPLAHPVSAQEPQWLRDARAREGQEVRAVEVRSTDGFFTATVAARVISDAIVEDDGIYEILLDIGSDVPVSCELMVDGFDLAAMIKGTADLAIEELGSLYGRVERRAVERVDAGAWGPNPYLAVDWIYAVDNGDQVRLGGLKQIVVSKDGHGFYCVHADVGYARSFEGAVRSLAESARIEPSSPKPYFTEISTTSLRGEKVGIAVITMELDEDGDTRMALETALVLRTADGIDVQDAYHVQWIRPDGSLISASHTSSDNGRMDTQVALFPAGAAGWIVEGEFQGTDVEKRLDATPAPESWVQEAHARRRLFQLDDVVGAEISTVQWASLDPTRIIRSEGTVLARIDDDHLSVRETLEGFTAEIVLERTTGLATKAVVPLGPVEVVVERVYVDGSF